MVTESYIQTAPDSLGKKVRTVEETVGANTVHTPVTILEDGAGTIISPATETGHLAEIADNTAGLGASTATENAGASTATSKGVSVGSFGDNAKGSYVQLIASTAAATRSLMLWIEVDSADTNANGFILMDIATGASGAESVLIPNIPHMVAASTNMISAPITFNVTIPSGTRIAARIQHQTSATGTWIVHPVIILME